MENKNLSDLYAENYLAHAAPVVESKTTNELEVLEEKKKFVKGKPKKKEKDSDEKVGGEYYTDSVQFDNIFGDIIKSLNEEFDAGIPGDSTMDMGEEGEEDFGDEQSFTISELRSMTLGDLANLIGGGYEDEGDMDMGDDSDIPLESYGFEGAGQHVGAQANYSGKAGLLPKTDLVTPDGNIKKEKAKVAGTKPTKTTGSEGQYHGAQGNYDGKAKKQGASTHVKANGDADFGKNKTGYGKAKGEDLY